MDKKEKLINLVRKHECIYDPQHNDYKNHHHKVVLWNRIGSLLEMTGPKAKDTWRALRDGYMRYKKAIKTGKKNIHYSWSSQMNFLDEIKSSKREHMDYNKSHDEVERQSSPVQSSVFLVETPFSSTQVSEGSPGPSWEEPLSSSRTLDFISSTQSPSNSEYDAVDHLFMSYSKTFKKLSLRKRAELKVALANLFAEAELSEMDNDPFNESSRSSYVTHTTRSCDPHVKSEDLSISD